MGKVFDLKPERTIDGGGMVNDTAYDERGRMWRMLTKFSPHELEKYTCYVETWHGPEQFAIHRGSFQYITLRGHRHTHPKVEARLSTAAFSFYLLPKVGVRVPNLTAFWAHAEAIDKDWAAVRETRQRASASSSSFCLLPLLLQRSTRSR